MRIHGCRSQFLRQRWGSCLVLSHFVPVRVQNRPICDYWADGLQHTASTQEPRRQAPAHPPHLAPTSLRHIIVAGLTTVGDIFGTHSCHYLAFYPLDLALCMKCRRECAFGSPSTADSAPRRGCKRLATTLASGVQSTTSISSISR